MTIKFNDGFAGFKLIKSKNIEEIKYSLPDNSKPLHMAYEFEHSSGAKLLFLNNNDPEMSFTIGFKTLPKDSTGVYHILEHSVLCGSRKFPVKEPFTNLLKSSMQTFLNAMTYPDKTVYPVASTNEKDFYNLIDVYMDAVFFPNIYKNKNIFYQEGGHPCVKVEDNKAYADFNGVVYNEMKGVYSEPDEHIFEGITSLLFKDSCYQYSSGGSPDIIKKLTYEEYLAQHDKNYQLDNSYIIAYGDLEICKLLEFLNDNYLSKQEEIKKWRSVNAGNTFNLDATYDTVNHPVDSYKEIQVNTHPDNACSGCAFVLDKDKNELSAIRILISALASSNESPLKAALLKHKFAADISFEIINEIKNPVIFIEAKGTKGQLGKNFKNIICEEFAKLRNAGISKDLLKAAISNCEYKLKDKEPECTTGIDTSLAIFNYWLYDQDSSMESLEYLHLIDWLKNKVETDYFEQIIDKYFINNKWNACVDIVPADIDMYEPLKEIDGAKQKDVNEICKNLKKWQEAPDSKEAEAKLPVLKKSDLGCASSYPKWEQVDKNTRYLFYDVDTNGITHVNRYYSLNNVDINDLPYVSILASIIGKLDTENFSSSEIDIITQSKIGSMLLKQKYFQDINNRNNLSMNFAIYASALDENICYLVSFIDELIYKTKFEDTEKIKTILAQQKVMMEQNFIRAGHSASINRAMSHILPIYNLSEKSTGIDYYFFIKNILNDFDKCSDNLIEKLKEISRLIFNTKPTISFMGHKNSFDVFSSKIDFNNCEKAPEKDWGNITLNKVNEAFVIPSNVHYCALCNAIDNPKANAKAPYMVAGVIGSLEYLWNQVRVKNGAYGAGLAVNSAGNLQYYSYRDPKVKDTFIHYKNLCDWLSEIDLDEQKLDNFIICSVSKIDAPATNKYKMLFQDSCYFTNTDTEKRLQNRAEIIKTTQNDIHQAGMVFKELTTNGCKCVFGGSDMLDMDMNDFNIIDLFND